ncbi:MAG: alpha/beta fold hydrolase, partial [Methylobacteriaceae bacterium]|nr:alpha/beta fold hydrolase [Methylobacteriaceae bacterium]
SLHPLARALAANGVMVYAPDIRGHGDTGRRGDVDFVGQPEQDVARLLREAKSRHPAARLTLAGFSLGGGLALRVAGGRDGAIADRTLLLAPMLGPRAPTARGGDDPWARPHLPRIIALSILNRLGVGAFDHLEAIAYAVPTGSERTQTGRYSWRLLRSLMPADYAADLAAAPRPVHVLVGADDQLFHADRYAPAVRAARPDARVDIVPGVDHIGLTLTPAGHAAIAAALR